jgi:hypothetical protein
MKIRHAAALALVGWLSKSWSTILVVLILLLLSAANGLAAPKKSRAEHHRDETAPSPQTEAIKQQETQIPLSAFREALSAVEEQAKGAQKQPNSEKETWRSPSVVVNIVLALVGAGYLIFAVLQWRVLLWAFLADHRPRLGIRQIALLTVPDEILATDSEGRFKRNNGVEIGLTLINRGGSDAKIVEGNITVKVDEVDSIEGMLGRQKVLPPFDVRKGTPSYNDERSAGTDIIVRPAEPYSLNKTMPLGSDNDVTKAYLAVHRERNLSSVALHVFGYFRYRSPGRWRARRTYFTAFCRRYDAEKGGFVVINEPDYEYED